MTCRESVSPQPESSTPGSISVQTIIERTAGYYGLPVEALLSSHRRARLIVHARQMAVSLAMALCGKTQSTVARLFRLDHSSVHAACRRVLELRTQDDAVLRQYHELLNFIRDNGCINPPLPPADLLVHRTHQLASVKREETKRETRMAGA